MTMNVNDRIRVRALKADGYVYRKWTATVESIEPNLIVTVAPAGSLIWTKGKTRPLPHHLRSYYWLDKFYNLLEVFAPDGALVEIYLNVASPPEVRDRLIAFKDHELDVSKVLPAEARIVDEDEFAEAIDVYHYSQEFQAQMYAVAHEALEIAERWVAKPAPKFE